MTDISNTCQCPEQDQDYHWILDTNEKGWQHGRCRLLFPGEPAGYNPVFDKELIHEKVSSLLFWLYENSFIYISNSSEGDWITQKVIKRCQTEDRYDQYSILLFILEAVTPSHSEFWSKLGHSLRQGIDPRDRCDECSALSTVSQGFKKWCSKCHSAQLEGKPF